MNLIGEIKNSSQMDQEVFQVIIHFFLTAIKLSMRLKMHRIKVNYKKLFNYAYSGMVDSRLDESIFSYMQHAICTLTFCFYKFYENRSIILLKNTPVFNFLVEKQIA